MKPTRAWPTTALALATFVLTACQTAPTNEIATLNGSIVAPAPKIDETGPGLDYKKQREVQAMRGLRYDTGRVRIEPTEAGAIVPNPNPDAADNWYQTGMRELMINNDRHAAIAAFSRAVINDPNRPDLYEGLGRALRFKGKADEAMAAFRSALDLAPDRAQAHYEFGMTQAMFGQNEAAMLSWKRAVQLDPTHGEAHLRLAIESYYHNEFDAAWTHLKQAQANNANVPAQFRALLSNASGRSN